MSVDSHFSRDSGRLERLYQILNLFLTSTSTSQAKCYIFVITPQLELILKQQGPGSYPTILPFSDISSYHNRAFRDLNSSSNRFTISAVIYGINLVEFSEKYLAGR